MNRSFLLFFSLTLICLVAGCTHPTTTAIPSSTVIPRPSATSSPIPPSATLTATPSANPTKSATPTLSPTPIASETPTASPTPTETPTPAPTSRPWRIWFSGAKFDGYDLNPNPLYYSVISDGTGLSQVDPDTFHNLAITTPPFSLPEEGRAYLEYSPDRSLAIAFVVRSLNTYIVNLSSKQTIPLYQPNSDDLNPVIAACWLPDGTYLRLVSSFGQVYQIKPDRTDLHLLFEITEISFSGFLGACSPDGQEAALYGYYVNDPMTQGIYILDLNTGRFHSVLIPWFIGRILRAPYQP